MGNRLNAWCAGISEQVTPGTTTVVEGAPGTGRTTVLDDLSSRWRGHVLRARCSALDGDLPFGVVAQLFDLVDPDLVPPEAVGAVRLTARTADFAVLHGVYRLAAALAGQADLLVVVDDAQWADAASWRWLAYLALRIQRLPIALVLTLSTGERCDDPSHAEVMAVGRRVVLEDLSPEAVADVVTASLGRPAPAFTAACLAVTGGNPLAVTRLVAALAEEGVAPDEESAWRVAERGAQVLGEIAVARLRRRSAAVVVTAHCLAVLGPDPHPAVLADLTGLGPLELAEARRCAGLLGVAGQAVLDDLPAPARADLHLRAARSLRAHGAPDRAVADHLLETSPGLPPWAAEVLDRAAQEAVNQGDTPGAARLLWRALREPVANPSRALRLLGIAELVGNLPGATARLREAFESDVDEEETAVALSYALHAEGNAAEVPAVLAGGSPLARAHLVVHGLAWQEAVPSQVSLDTPAGVLHHVMVGDITAEEAVSRVSAGEMVPTDVLSSLTSAMTLNLADSLDEALAVLDDVDRAQAPPLRALTYVMRANVQRRKGDLVSAHADLELAEDHLRQDRRWHAVSVWHAALLADILLEEGRLDEAEALVAESSTDEARRVWQYAALLTVRGRLLTARGEDREALEAFLAAGRHCAAWPYRNPAPLAWRSGAALACAAIGDSERARDLASEEVELARAWGAPRALGMALRAEGRVTAGAAGRTVLEEAVRVLRGSPARLELARALVDLGVVVRRQGDTAGARACLRDAVDLAQKCGSTAMAARAYSELVATSAGPRRMRQTGPTALTPAEHQVAELAARGRSDEEIASVLLMPADAVAALLPGIYRKLGVGGRSQLSNALFVD
ncbi:AAA ATPase domain-containing protein [Lentzea fradiae]|uniref:AAA ATPase domain-containing protein n=1 Tax=Lentzea fradiae TaxID=200378 RepID=A0A1G7UIE2_9PSEU|nr:AAA family ATPase [Lentzea fradiae]SDG47325.1 AAA ATPase domain-containing protein [Lentzea fradiae]